MAHSKQLAALLVGSFLTAGLATGIAAAAPDPPADDFGNSVIATSNGVLYEGCHDHKYRYRVDDRGDYAYWDAEVHFIGPGGGRVASDHLHSDTNPATGTRSVGLCDDDPTGKYRLLLEVTYYDENDEEQLTVKGLDRFRLRQPRTRTRYTVTDATPRYRQLLTFRIVSKIEGPRTFVPNKFENVVLEARRNGTWERIRGSKTETDNRGVVKLKARWLRHRPLTIRAATLGTKVFDRSESKPKTIG